MAGVCCITFGFKLSKRRRTTGINGAHSAADQEGMKPADDFSWLGSVLSFVRCFDPAGKVMERTSFCKNLVPRIPELPGEVRTGYLGLPGKTCYKNLSCRREARATLCVT